jgi:hypothetical protein
VKKYKGIDKCNRVRKQYLWILTANNNFLKKSQ